MISSAKAHQHAGEPPTVDYNYTHEEARIASIVITAGISDVPVLAKASRSRAAMRRWKRCMSGERVKV